MTDERFAMTLDVCLNSKEHRKEGVSLFLDAFWCMFDAYHMHYWLCYDMGVVTVVDDDDNVLLWFPKK